MSIFNPASNLQLTTLMSVESNAKPPVDYCIRYVGFQGDKGYDYFKVIRPDLVPEYAEISVNLFYKNGEVTEQDMKNNTWARYRCDKRTFIGWLNYVYSGAGILIGIAQYALQHPDSFTVTEEAGMATYRPRMEKFSDPDSRQMFTAINSLTFNQTTPILLQAMRVQYDSDKSHLQAPTRLKFSYGPTDFHYPAALQPPAVVPEVPDRLMNRFVYP